MVVLLTGITGLVGSHIAIALLRAGHQLVALSRSKNAATAETRARRVLRLYPGFVDEIHNFAALHVVDGDIRRPGCGLADDVRDLLVDRIDLVLHCAGQVAFAPQASPAAFDTNVDGVRHVVELADRIHCRRLIHVGTAYIEPGLRGGGFRTDYEHSKFDGEKVLTAETAECNITAQIVRPSIVTGDRHHGFTPTYHGIYPFLHYAATYAKDIRRADPAYWLARGFPLTSSVNLIPADHLAAVVLKIAELPATDTCFNVINPKPWRVTALSKIIFEFFGIKIQALENFNAGHETMSTTSVKAAEMLLETYAPYFSSVLTLDTATTDRLMRANGIPPIANREEWIQSLLRWSVGQDWKDID